MTRSNKSRSHDNNDLSKKMDQLLKKFCEVEEKMDERMSDIEKKYETIQKKMVSNEENNRYLRTEISKLKTKMNDLDQEQLCCDIIVRGVKYIESSDAELAQLVFDLLYNIYQGILEEIIVTYKRLGNKSSESSSSTKPILIKLNNKTVKEEIMRLKKYKHVDCSMLALKGEKVGTVTDIIYISDNLTPANASLYYAARQLKKKGVIKFAWTKMGKVYIRKDELSRAENLVVTTN